MSRSQGIRGREGGRSGAALRQPAPSVATLTTVTPPTGPVATAELDAAASPRVPLESALYCGWVRHRRLDPAPNAFRYGVYQLLLNLDELPELARRIPFLGHNTGNLTGYFDRDHLGRRELPTRTKLAEWLAAHGRQLGTGPVLLLTNLRVLGYVFNPVSYFYCLDDSGRLRFVVAEVNNTFGESYLYLLADLEQVGQRALLSRQVKVFHVSPFMQIDDVSYDWVLTPPGENLVVHIDEFRAGAKFFDATLNLSRRPLTASSLAKAMVRYPHMTARTIFLIHWQALKLWLKGAPFHRKPEPPPNGLSDR